MNWDIVKIVGGTIIALAVQFGGVVWVARGVASKADTNEMKISEIVHEQRSLAEDQKSITEDLHETHTEVRVAATKVDAVQNKLDTVEDLVLKIYQKVHRGE